MRFQFEQPIRQLEKRKGGYFYFQIDAETVEQWERKRATRLQILIDEQVQYGCGLNHLGDGNFFVILATKNLKKLGKGLGDTVKFEVWPDPNPLGVEVPEVLEVLLAQDSLSQKEWELLTDGKKRSLIYSVQRIKDFDKQVQTILQFLELEAGKRKK